MRAYGQMITLIARQSGEEAVYTAFLQPILKERETPPAAVTPLGAVSGQRWLYIGPPDQDVRPGDLARFDSLRLAVQEVQTVYFRGEVLYHRAVLRREKEDAE